MGKVLRIASEHAASKNKTELQNVKLQMILNMCLDKQLKPAVFKAAVYLLVGPGNGPKGECYMSDHDLAECIGVSEDTIAKTVVKSAAFGQYFELDRGQNSGVATDYSVNEAAIAGGVFRKANSLSWTQRADGSEVETKRRKRQKKRGENFPALLRKTGKFPTIGWKKPEQKAGRTAPPTQRKYP